MARELLTSAELADYLHIHPGTVKNWRYRGFGPPATKVGRKLLFDRELVDQWLADRTDPVGAPQAS